MADCVVNGGGNFGSWDVKERLACTKLSKLAPYIFKGMCEPCILILQQRLTEICSGNGLYSSSAEESTVNANDVDIGRSDVTFRGGSVTPSKEGNNSTLSGESPFTFKPGTLLEGSTIEIKKGDSVKLDNARALAWSNAKPFSPKTPVRSERYSGASQKSLAQLPLESLEDGFPCLPTKAVEGRSNLTSSTPAIPPLSALERELRRLKSVSRNKNFQCMEFVEKRLVNVAEGLELHTGIISAAEQDRLVKLVHNLQDEGRKGRLKERTYSEPRKWMRGKGRITLQFGCCYNYAVDKNNNPPGILRREEVDPLPPLLKSIVRRLIRWQVLPKTCIPDSCIINIYEKDDCIPPHIDHHDFVRPFCTVSLLSECKIVFGANLKIVGPGEFDGPLSIPLPVGSVLVLKGNGADVAKHAVPAVPCKRISITFRKMHPSKVPDGYQFPVDMQGIEPLAM